MKKLVFAFTTTVLLGIPTAAATLEYVANLSGPSSPGTGSAITTIDTAANTMQVQATFSGLLGTTTASHIHCCTATPLSGTVPPATQVPTFPGFPLGVNAGTYNQTFDLTLAGSYNPAFVTNNGGNPASAEAALLLGLSEGRAYLNIHTSLFPGGEISGFLVRTPEPATVVFTGLGLAAVALCRKRLARR